MINRVHRACVVLAAGAILVLPAAAGAHGGKDRDYRFAPIAFLGDPSTHGGVDTVERFETHGNLVFLAGTEAWKIKRGAVVSARSFNDGPQDPEAAAQDAQKPKWVSRLDAIALESAWAANRTLHACSRKQELSDLTKRLTPSRWILMAMASRQRITSRLRAA